MHGFAAPSSSCSGVKPHWDIGEGSKKREAGGGCCGEGVGASVCSKTGDFGGRQETACGGFLTRSTVNWIRATLVPGGSTTSGDAVITDTGSEDPTSKLCWVHFCQQYWGRDL